MTGTALTEEEEFRSIYKLDVIEIPTNKPIARKDNPDAVYKNEKGKTMAIIRRIEECHAKGQPILVGTFLSRNRRSCLHCSKRRASSIRF